jgi:hypothetical protein
MATNSKETEEHGVRGGKLDGYPDFGSSMLKEFQFEDGCKSQLWLWLTSRSKYEQWYISNQIRILDGY